MEIKVKRTKEWTKGLLGGKSLLYKLHLTVALSDSEKSLIEKYFEPSISSFGDLQKYFQSEEFFMTVKIEKEESSLSKYSITAQSHLLGNIQKLEEAAKAELANRIEHLKSIDAWEGDDAFQL